MNAVAPPGLEAAARRSDPRHADDENVRLTIDFEDSDEDAPVEPSAAAAQPGATAPASDDPFAAEPLRGPRPDRAAQSAKGASVAEAGAYVPAQLASIEVTLSVEIGNRLVPLRDLLTVEPGQLFALDRMTHEPVTILVNGKPFAHGEVVAMGERFGVRLLDLLPGGKS